MTTKSYRYRNQMHVESVRDLPVQGTCTCILHTGDNNVILYIGSTKTLELYDEHFHRKTTVSLSAGIRDMASTGSGQIIATDGKSNQLLAISPSGSTRVIRSTFPLVPSGICINNKEQIVVGLYAQSMKPSVKLAIYSPDGSLLLQEVENDTSGQPLFKEGIEQVKQNGNGDYIVSDGDRVVCVSNGGKFIWDYQVMRCNPYFDSCVSGIVCDRNNNIIIAEYDNSRITLLNSEGKLVATLLTEKDGINLPRTISIDRLGDLWIGHLDGLKVVRYLK